jgi:transposase InsO family protein
MGLLCSENRVARLMRAEGLCARQTRRFRSTTKRNESHQPASNLLRRDFEAERPDQKWLADITYIPTSEGWLYLAAILDLYGRRVVGWAMDERMTTDLTLRALKMALRQRRPGPGLVHHSDQGSQYTDGRYRALLAKRGIEASMNGAGTWYDNAPMESFFGTLKSERVHHIVYRNRDEATTDLFYYIEGWYNRRRLHSSLAYESPEAFEQLYHKHHEAGLTPCPQKLGKVKACPVEPASGSEYASFPPKDDRESDLVVECNVGQQGVAGTNPSSDTQAPRGSGGPPGVRRRWS